MDISFDPGTIDASVDGSIDGTTDISSDGDWAEELIDQLDDADLERERRRQSSHDTAPKWLHSLLRVVLHFRDGVLIIKLLAWIVFLTIFPPLVLYNGQLIPAIVLSIMMLGATAYLLAGDTSDHKWPIVVRVTRSAIYLEHSVIIGIALWQFFQPAHDGWQRVDFAPFRMSVKLFQPRPHTLIVSARGSHYTTRTGQEAWSPISRLAPTFSGWVAHYEPLRKWYWFGMHKGGYLNIYDPATKRWRGTVCPKGQTRALTSWNGRLFLVANGRLYTAHHPYDTWEQVQQGKICRFCGGIAATPYHPRPLLLTVGKRWHQSHDGGKNWRDVTPPGNVPLSWGKAAISRKGWRYVYKGETWGSGHLYVGAPGKPFVRRDLPRADIRILITHPSREQTIWIGTWGVGIYQSNDAGKTWIALGLQHHENRFLAFDPISHKLYASSDNMFYGAGLYVKTLSKPKTKLTKSR